MVLLLRSREFPFRSLPTSKSRHSFCKYTHINDAQFTILLKFSFIVLLKRIFHSYNIEGILGMVRAAEAKRSPLIIQMFPWAVTFSSGLLVHTAAHAARSASVPIAIHLDHAQDEALIKQAADLPFDSIMVDMSHYEMEENLTKTKELVKYCNERQKCTEAEPGRI
jgi:fructose/tagatose bisphosphate aldolase